MAAPGFPIAPQPGVGVPPVGAPGVAGVAGVAVPPPNAVQQYWYRQYTSTHASPDVVAWFNTIDEQKTGFIRAEDLAKALSALYTGVQPGAPPPTETISVNTARHLIQVFDADRNGLLTIAEFVGMHAFIMKMRQAFVSADVDRNNKLSYLEVGNALRAEGFAFSHATAANLLLRFDTDKDGFLTWADFIETSAYLSSLKTVFEWLRNQGKQAKAAKKATKNLEKAAKKAEKSKKKTERAPGKVEHAIISFEQFISLDTVFHQHDETFKPLPPATVATPVPQPQV